MPCINALLGCWLLLPTLTQIPQPMHSSSEIHASLLPLLTSIHSLPAGQHTHSSMHAWALQLSTARVHSWQCVHASRTPVERTKMEQACTQAGHAWLVSCHACNCHGQLLSRQSVFCIRTNFHHWTALLAFLSALLGLAPAQQGKREQSTACCCCHCPPSSAATPFPAAAAAWQHLASRLDKCCYLSSLTMAIRVRVSSGSLSFFLGGCTEAAAVWQGQGVSQVVHFRRNEVQRSKKT